MILYMKTFLEFDWLRAVQFQGNTVPGNGYRVICFSEPFFGTVLLFSYTLLIGDNTISRAIWKNMQSWVFQRPQVTFVVWTCAIMIVFEKLSRAYFFQIALQSVLLPLLNFA